jgi:hypothetical protein
VTAVRDLFLCAHATAVAKLRAEGVATAPVPSSVDVLAELRRDPAVRAGEYAPDRWACLQLARLCGLRLADSD